MRIRKGTQTSPTPRPYYSALPSSSPRRTQTFWTFPRLAVAVLACAMALTVAITVNPSTKGHHTFTAASDYRSERESGCTNSGAGCHGRETEYSDFNAYHPDSECATCHDYQGAGCIMCHAPREHECALCHDGTLKQAPDRVRITDPYPSGHYRETTHTAMGTVLNAR